MTTNTRSDGQTVQFIDEDGAPYGIKHVNNKPRVSSMPYLYDIAEGNVENHTPFSKLGYTPSLTASVNTDIWSYAPTQPVYLFPTVAQQMEILSTNNVDDIGTSIKTGTSTGGSLTTLIDTGANFTGATAVAIGDTILLDKSGTSPEFGYVTAVTSATQLAVAGGFSRGGSGSGRSYIVLDNSATAGVQAVETTYLNGSFVEKREISITNGTTEVVTVNTDLYRINAFRVVAAGVNKVPTGNLSIRNLTNTPVYSYITAGFTRARNVMYTVPAGKTLYITTFMGGYATTGNANKEYARITPKANMDPTTGFQVDGIFYPSMDIVAQNVTVPVELSIPLRILEKTDIKTSAIATQTGAISTTIMGWLETND
jgi:hypothetical protein